MRNFLIAIIVCLKVVFSNSNAQNFVYMDGKMYESTKEILLNRGEDMIIRGREFRDINIFFVKVNQFNGYIGLNCNMCGFFREIIAGELLIFFDDGSTLKISPLGLKNDIVDDNSISLYKLNNNQISLLKKNNIKKIRYKIYTFFDYNSKNLQFDSNRSVNNNSEVDTSVVVKELFD